MNDRIGIFAEFIIGKYRLSLSRFSKNSFWLTNKEGEGLEIGVKELEKFLNQYFKENY